MQHSLLRLENSLLLPPSAMVSHHDVDVPGCLRRRMGTLLAEFEAHIAEQGRRPTQVTKEVGGHVTPWWLVWSEDPRCCAQSRIQCGETIYKAVNPTPHLWVRGKPGLPCLSRGGSVVRGICRVGDAVRRSIRSISDRSLTTEQRDRTDDLKGVYIEA